MEDFSYAVLETVHLSMNPKLDGAIHLEPVYVEQCFSITFMFVRGDGNCTDLNAFYNPVL